METEAKGKRGFVHNRLVQMFFTAVLVTVIVLVVLVPSSISLNQVSINPVAAIAGATPASGGDTPGPASTGTPRPTPTTTPSSSRSPTPTSPPDQGGLLPGEQLWNGVSSLIFGTTITGEWGTPNLEFIDAEAAPGTPNTAAQNKVKQAGFSMVRAFVDHHDLASSVHGAEMTDAEIQAKDQTIANIGAQCLMTLERIDPAASSQGAGDRYTDLGFAEHVVTLTDGNHPGFPKCSMFEIGNESANGPQSITGYYLNDWNVFVSALRKIRPDAKFIGPVFEGMDPDNLKMNMQVFLQGVVQNNYPMPDALSWHYYPCGPNTGPTDWATCLTPQYTTNFIAADIANVRAAEQATIGKQLPLGISEWSVDPNDDGMQLQEPQMSNWTTLILQAMIQNKLDFANEYDMQSYACYGACDMLQEDANNTPRPYFNAFTAVIQEYKP